ncbi:hypothetical protein BKI52_08870 [marine bacterium AO1-C]|nr:hypothetical protein BKI52_08870 [marine bacterium AO1-C]
MRYLWIVWIGLLLWGCGEVTPKASEKPSFEKRYAIIPPQKRDIEARLTPVKSQLGFVDFLRQQGNERVVSYYNKLKIPEKVDRYCRVHLKNNLRDSIYIISRDSILYFRAINYPINQDKKREENEGFSAETEPLQFLAIKYVQNLLLPTETKAFYLLYPNKVDSMLFQIVYSKSEPKPGSFAKTYPTDFLLINDKKSNKVYIKPKD